MNLRTAPPILVAALGLVFAVLLGPGWYWVRAGDMLSDARVARRLALAQKEQQRKVQGWNFWTIEIDSLASELKEEKARLRKQTEQLDQRSARLDSERQELDKLRAEIELMRQQMDQRVIAIGTDEARNLHSLAQIYSALSAPAAVAIIREMDDTTAVKILSLMKAEVVAPIFDEMTRSAATDPTLARRAAVLTDKLRLMKSNRPNPAAVSSSN